MRNLRRLTIPVVAALAVGLSACGASGTARTSHPSQPKPKLTDHENLIVLSHQITAPNDDSVPYYTLDCNPVTGDVLYLGQGYYSVAIDPNLVCDFHGNVFRTDRNGKETPVEIPNAGIGG